jgi:hypothetical protein
MRTATVAAAAALLLAGCRIEVGGSGSAWSGPGAEAVETFEVAAPGARTLSVESGAGSIEAGPAESAGTVTVRARKRAPREEDLVRVRPYARLEGDAVVVGYEVDGDRDGIAVSFEVAAPPSLRARLRSGAGSIRAEGFEGGLEARSGAGSVESISVKGDQSLESGAGSIRVAAADGCVRAESGAGSIRASGRLRGDSSLVTSAGSVEVHLHPDARLTVAGKTAAGGVRTDFGLAVTGRFAAKEVGGTIGDGSDGSLRVESSAGSLSILRQ